MSEMIERVARAICWKNGMNPDLTLGGDDQNFLWHEYVAQARAAIEAMREPTASMKVAGAFTYRRIELGNGKTAQGLALGDEPISSYIKMISTALKETP